MKYIFFGTPRFARLVLEKLLDSMPPVAVITNPDRPAGRKKILTPPPVKSLVLENKSEIEILQPEKLADVRSRLLELQPDVFVVAAYGKIIRQDILDIPRLGTIGTHPSLLPAYRGASPIQSVILAGEEITGTTLYLMDEEVDHGPILAAKELSVDDKNYLELEEALAKLSGELLLETLPRLDSGDVRPRSQDESLATLTGKFETADGFVAWKDLQAAVGGEDSVAAVSIWRKIRALNPEPGVWTEKGKQRIKLLRADLENKIQPSKLILREIQRAGKTPELLSSPLP